jgi:hypothetical protein
MYGILKQGQLEFTFELTLTQHEGTEDSGSILKKYMTRDRPFYRLLLCCIHQNPLQSSTRLKRRRNATISVDTDHWCCAQSASCIT